MKFPGRNLPTHNPSVIVGYVNLRFAYLLTWGKQRKQAGFNIDWDYYRCISYYSVAAQWTVKSIQLAERFCWTLQDTFDTRMCMSQTQKYTIDFTTASESDLQDVIIPLTFDMQQSGHVHGLAFWFEVAFIGSQFVFGSPLSFDYHVIVSHIVYYLTHYWLRQLNDGSFVIGVIAGGQKAWLWSCSTVNNCHTAIHWSFCLVAPQRHILLISVKHCDTHKLGFYLRSSFFYSPVLSFQEVLW